MKVVFRTNLGSMDAKNLDLNHVKCQAGKSLDVDDTIGEKLIKMGVAVSADKAESDSVIQSAKGVPDAEIKAADEEVTTPTETEESPVSDTNAAEAIDAISRMRSVERLTEIVNNDTRPTVKKAAQDRLEALQQ